MRRGAVPGEIGAVATWLECRRMRGIHRPAGCPMRVTASASRTKIGARRNGAPRVLDPDFEEPPAQYSHCPSPSPSTQIELLAVCPADVTLTVSVKFTQRQSKVLPIVLVPYPRLQVRFSTSEKTHSYV